MSILKKLFGFKTTQSNVIKILNPNDFKTQITSKKVQLVDVRTPNEFQSGHINGAKNIDAFSGTFNETCNTLNKEEPIYVYCRRGSRSKQASKRLEALGFKEIYDLKGGILNY